MDTGQIKYLFGFLSVAALVALVFWLVIRGITGGGGAPEVQIRMIDFAKTDTVVRMQVSGPVVIDEEYRSATVTIGRTGNTIEVKQGYNGNVLSSRTYASNEEAYATFLRALDLQGYTNGDDNPARADSRGFCPSGRVYTFQIVTGASTVQQFWTTSCGGGTFGGETNTIRKLFRAQIPDYSDMIRRTGLN